MTVARNARGRLPAILTTTAVKRGQELIVRGSGCMTAIPDVRRHRETVAGMRIPVVIRTTETAGTMSGPDMMIAGRHVMIGVILRATTVTVAGEGVL